MSTEQEGKARLTALLADLSNHITPVSCVRHPVDQFRSHVQRFLKHRNGPFPPNDIRLRETIIATDAAFGGTQKLIASDHKPPHSGDIVCDFAPRFLSPWVSPTEPPSPDTNVGLSTEALVLMARPHAEAGGDFEAARVVPAPFDRRKIWIGWTPIDAPHAVARGSGRCPERRERTSLACPMGKLQRPGLDIDRIVGSDPPDWTRTAPAETLFVHDPERLDRLHKSVEQYRNESTPIARDFLLRFLHRKLRS